MRWLIALCLLLNVILSGCGADTTATKDNDFAPLTQIIISSENIVIADKTSNLFTAEGNFSNLFTRDISSEVSWTSSNPAVATIDSSGLATAIALGITRITAELDGEFDYFELEVTNATLSRLEISPVAPQVPNGLTQQFSAIGTFSDASEQIMTNSVVWSSVNTEIAAIDQTGLATAFLEGTTNITAAFDGITKTTPLTVTAASLTAIEVDPPLFEVPQKLNKKFTATGYFSDDTSRDISAEVNWSSSNTTVATVDASGIAIGSSAGTSIITASSGALSSSATLTVTNVILTGIDITPPAPTVAVNGTQQLTATGTFNDNSTANITSYVIWTTADGTVATISNDAEMKTEGIVTGVRAGSTSVSATSGTLTDSVSLTVN